MVPLKSCTSPVDATSPSSVVSEVARHQVAGRQPVELAHPQPQHAPGQAAPRAQDDPLRGPLEQPVVHGGDHGGGEHQHAEDHERLGQRVVGGERLDHLARGQRLGQARGGSEQPEHRGDDQGAAVRADMGQESAQPAQPRDEGP
jgi:hypothetical protein